MRGVTVLQIKPDRIRLAAEPGQLALRVVAGRLFEPVHTVVEFLRSLKIGEELLVPDGLGGCAVPFPVTINQFRLLQNPAADHLITARVNAAVQKRPVPAGQAEAERAVGRPRRAGGLPLIAHPASRGAVKLQCPDDAGRVVGMHPRRIFRVHPDQLLIKRLRTFFGQAAVQGVPQGWVGLFGGKIQTAEQAGHVQPRSAHHKGQAASGGDLLDGAVCQADKIRHAEDLIRRKKIHKVMRDAVFFFFRHLGGSHIQTFVNLHGVSADDLPIKLSGQRHGKGGFSGGGGAPDGNNPGTDILRQGGQTAFPAPSGLI